MFWVVALVVSMVGCFQQILTAYDKWDLPPVLVSFAENYTPVWRVPFPAVTVCPEIKSRSSAFNFTDAVHRHLDPDVNTTLSVRELEMLDLMSLVCERVVNTRGMAMVSEEELEKLYEVAPIIVDTMFICSWENGPPLMNCTSQDGSLLFRPVLLDVGLCYTFNLLDSTELFNPEAVQHARDPEGRHRDAVGWNPEDGYPRGAPRDAYPRRAVGEGGEPRLNVLMRANASDIDYLCGGPVQGFKVQLHSPAELPQLKQQFFRVPHNKDVTVAVRPDVMTTSEGLRYGYKPARRQCYFAHERQLRYFRIYTQNNCQYECKANFTRDVCGCAFFYMPRSHDIPICGAGFLGCIKNVSAILMSREIEEDTLAQALGTVEDPGVGGGGGVQGSRDCRCLPACNSLRYGAQPSQADYEWQQSFAAHSTDPAELGEGATLSRLVIYFEEMEFIAGHRSALYGQTDFLASCGGLLGLFSGFSLISLVEIMYHLSIRLWCNARRYHHRRRERHRLRRRDQDPEAQEREHEAGEAEGGGGLHADTGEEA